MAAHHGEVAPETVEAFIVATADAISGGRPGARREMVDLYIKRLEALESIANSFPAWSVPSRFRRGGKCASR